MILLKFPSGQPIHDAPARCDRNHINDSAVSPALRAVRVRKIAPQCSGGIESRCAHLRAAEMPTPTSQAKASGRSHKATISRKLQIMQLVLGQPVHKIKPIVSHDGENSLRHNFGMSKDAEKLAESAWREAFRLRLKTARGVRTQEDMAELLGITQTRYSKYEAKRASQMPPRLLPLFAKICGVSLPWLIDGKETVAKMPQVRKKKRAA